MDWEKTQMRTKKAFEFLSSLVGIVLGIAMIIQGAHRIYLGMQDDVSLYYFAGYGSLAVGGIAVAAWSLKDRIKMVGVYALSLGASRAFLRIGDIASTENVLVIMGASLFLLLALNLMRIGFHFSRGNVVSRMSLILTSSILAGASLFLVVLGQFMWKYLGTTLFGLDPYLSLVNFFMYLTLIALMDTEVIRSNTVLARQAAALDRIRFAYSLDEKTFIYDDAAKALLERSGPMWRTIDDDVVQSEMEFEIIGDGSKMAAVAQIWKGKEPLFVTVIQKGESVFNANRFRVDSLTESDGILYGYGKDGTRFHVLVKGRETS